MPEWRPIWSTLKLLARELDRLELEGRRDQYNNINMMAIYIMKHGFIDQQLPGSIVNSINRYRHQISKSIRIHIIQCCV